VSERVKKFPDARRSEHSNGRVLVVLGSENAQQQRRRWEFIDTLPKIKEFYGRNQKILKHHRRGRILQLGPRLAAIASYIQPGSRVADIGTDHAYLPAYLVEHSIITYAVAGDIHAGPLESARELVHTCNFTDKIAVRLGDGLAVVEPGEVDTVVIAGMGGTTMIQILSAGWNVTKSLRRLVLQPMVGAGVLRHWLVEHNFHIVDEQLVKDDGRIYEIIVAELGVEPVWRDLVLEFGPVLWGKKDPLLREYWQEILAHFRKVQSNLAQSSLGVEHPKYGEYAKKVNYLEERIACL
jgi:tRNA (adenine22-N1)-methyltransferase